MAANRMAIGAAVILGMAGVAYSRVPDAPAEVRIQVIGAGQVSGLMLSAAQTVASGILTTAGAHLRWTQGQAPHPPSRAIVIRFLDFAPKGHPVGALAESHPYAGDGVRITVFLDRIWAVAHRQPLLQARVLGHVLAHEIAHVLRGTNSHSWTGVMKAHWDDADYRAMRTRGLTFVAGDIVAIRARLTHKEDM